MTTLPDTNIGKQRLSRFIMSPNTLARRLTCKYPTPLWENRDGIITCPVCGDTLNTFYVWQFVLVGLWLLDMGIIYGF